MSGGLDWGLSGVKEAVLELNRVAVTWHPHRACAQSCSLNPVFFMEAWEEENKSRRLL